MRLAWLGVVTAAGALAAGCGGSSKLDKTGKPVHEKPVVLTLADHENSTLDVGNWIREVETRSGGTIRIDVRNQWRQKDPDYDRGTITDVRAGRIDIAKIAARSWDEVGVPSFRALVAPLLVDSYPLERQLLASDVPGAMLKGVSRLDLLGLAVLPGMLRRPLGVSRALRAPADFAGARIGIRPGGVARATFAALGGKSVAYVPGDPAAVSRLDGAELDVDVIAGNAYDRGSRALTANVNLWPRAVTLVMNKRSFAALSAKQKSALTDAAPAAIPPTVKALQDLDRATSQVLCRRGLRFVTATDADLRSLRDAVGPVYANLERDAQTKRAIARIRSLKGRLGADGAPDLAKCSGDAGAGQPAGSSPMDGVYHSTVTRAQLLRNPKYEQGEDNASNHGDFTLTIRRGRWKLAGSDDGIPIGGTLAVDGQRVTLRPTYPADAVGQEFVYRWSRYRGVLSFTKVTAGPTTLVVHPWRQ
jgi:TRAP-type C4-dicarboxylate transport system substrate-binding protein